MAESRSVRRWRQGLPKAVILTVASALVGTVVLSWLLAGIVLHIWPWGVPPEPKDPVTVLDVIKVALTVVAGIGGAVALVVSYRKQHLAEADAKANEILRFVERFGAAATQLGDQAPAVRLAGVYAMASLADEYATQRQQCIDVLCGYLRLPYSSDPDDQLLSGRVSETVHASVDRTVREQRTYSTQPNDREVRATVVSVIRAHLIETAPVSWSDKNFDFTGAVLHNPHLSQATFAGEVTRFDWAQFTGETTSFSGVKFAGETTSFYKAQFTSDKTSFDQAQFTSKTTRFGGAQFTGKATRFDWAQFTSKETSFVGAQFTGRTTTFRDAQFTSARTSFDKAAFTGEQTSFYRAQFTSVETRFGGAQFTSVETRFGGAQFTSVETRFDGAHFAGTATSFVGAQFTGAATSFGGAEFTGEEVRFEGATWDRVQVTFDNVTIGPDTQFNGLDGPTLTNGATITANEQPFTGPTSPPPSATPSGGG